LPDCSSGARTHHFTIFTIAEQQHPMNLSIIIPLYNEEALIVSVLEELNKVKYPDFIQQVEIVVVDDASKDGSADTVAAYITDKPHITLVRHPKNQGKGAAVKTGVKHSQHQHILIQDADLELSPVDIPALLCAMHQLKIPFVNGSRYLPGVIRTQAAYRRYFLNKVFTRVTAILINTYLTDMACGYKLFTRELYEKLDLREHRFGFEAELIIKCGRLRKNWIAEVPVHYAPRNLGQGKKFRTFDGLRIMGTILKYGLLRMGRVRE
jgi:glycosyltransferase involved in cell wall biosynthesis